MYRIRGGDGLEYGPVEAEKMAEWIRERRLNRQSLVLKDGEVGWRPLGEFPEFSELLRSMEIPPQLVLQVNPTILRTSEAEVAGEQVRLPGILLAVYGGLSTLSSLSSFTQENSMASVFKSSTTRIETQGLPPEFVQLIHFMANMPRGWANVGAIVELLVSIVILWGAIEMVRLHSRSLAIAAAILSLIPCLGGCCCCIGIPLGIWSLSLVTRPSIARHFHR